MKKIGIMIVAIVLITGLIGIYIWQTSDQSIAVNTVHMENETISSTITVPGTVQFREEQDIYFQPETGEITDIHVEPGDVVEKDSVLVSYENEQLNMQKEQYSIQEEDIYLRLNVLQKAHDRLHEEEKELAKETSKKEAAEAFEEEHDQNELERKMANNELRQLHLQKEELDQQIADLEIKSEIEGVVLEVNRSVYQNEQSQEPQPLIRLAVDELIVEGMLSEFDILEVEAGQSVTLRSDVLQDEEWQGEVAHIAYVPESNEVGSITNTVHYPVEVEFESQDIDLRPGFELIMEIETDHREGPTLPLEAVVNENDEHIVYVVHDGRTERRTVQVGQTTHERIEITAGLEGDENVIIEPPHPVEDGTEVVIR